MLWGDGTGHDVGMGFALSKPRLPTLPKELCIVLLRLPRVGESCLGDANVVRANGRSFPIISWGWQGRLVLPAFLSHRGGNPSVRRKAHGNREYVFTDQ